MVQAHACLCIECAERLIEQDHGGLVDESPHNRHPLLHSSRKLGGIVVLESFKPDQTQPMQGLFPPLGRCDAADCQRKFNIAQSSQPWKQVAVLSHVADVGVQTNDWSTLVEETAPSDAASKPAARRNKVVLPQPEGPTTVVI